MSKRLQKEVSQVSDVGSLELTEDIIRERAYRLFEQRGYEHGHDLQDWLEAEAEITERNLLVQIKIQCYTRSRQLRLVATP